MLSFAIIPSIFDAMESPSSNDENKFKKNPNTIKMKFRLPIFLFIILFIVASCGSKKELVQQPKEVQVEEPQTTTEEIIEEEIVPDLQDQDTIPAEVPVEKEEPKTAGQKPPLDIHEFRAAWVATVANINWPSKPGLSTIAQQQEAIKLLDLLKENNFNAVIFQVRPQADALYESELEPWSYFLTGEQGKAPQPYYDPLRFWVKMAHERGLELHVWLNPYRAHHTTGGEISDKSIIKTHPELVVPLANGMWWMDPALKGTQDRSAAVVKDLVSRYDIDGVHFDDYFYPYDSYNNGKDFPDDKSWKAYQERGGKLSRGDWRRDNVNIFIKRVYDGIKAAKPEVKLGISPFGIWRPGYPQSVKGYDQYDKLYADAKLWLNEGWLDYFTPQLYWKINQIGQSFPELLGWWSSENHKNRHLWPGMNVGLGGGPENSDEIFNQIMITRGMTPNSPGAVHWSIAPLVKYPELAKTLVEGPYKKKALVPASPWLKKKAPIAPKVSHKIVNDRLELQWTYPGEDEIARWVVYFKYKEGGWDYKILESGAQAYSLQNEVGKKKVRLEALGITAVDRAGNQSEFIQLKLNP